MRRRSHGLLDSLLMTPRMLQPHDPAAPQSAAVDDLHGHLRVDGPDPRWERRQQQRPTELPGITITGPAPRNIRRDAWLGAAPSHPVDTALIA